MGRKNKRFRIFHSLGHHHHNYHYYYWCFYCCCYYYFTLSEVFPSALAGGLSQNTGWQQVSSDLLQISQTLMADLNHAVARMVSILPLISIFSNLSFKPFGTVPRALFSTGITVNLILYLSTFWPFLFSFCDPLEQQIFNYYFYFTHLRVFYTNVSWWFSTGVLRDSKSPQLSKTLLNILIDLNNAIVWMFSSHPSISSPLVTLPSAIGITVTIIFCQFSGKVLVLISLFALLQFYPVVNQNGKVHYSLDSPFFC